MRLTTTRLTTYYTCPFLFYVQYVVRQPLPVLARRRRFGNVVHAAIAAYEQRGRALDAGIDVVREQGKGLAEADVAEAESILHWRHERRRVQDARLVLAEGPLTTSIDGHRLDARMDRLDEAVGKRLLLAEYKTGRHVDLDLVRLQMSVLAYAVWRVLGRAPVVWELEILGARRIVEIEADRDGSSLASTVSPIASGIAADQWEPKPFDDRYCARCPARAFCPRVCRDPLPLQIPPPKSDAQLALFAPLRQV